MNSPKDLPFFISIPHSGEKIPGEVTWLKGLSEPKLMRDVDRFVDKLYAPVIQKMELMTIKTSWHRYVVDLNRNTDQIDQASVKGAQSSKGTHPKGLHWSVTTHNEVLIKNPMSFELHQSLVEKYYQPFHDAVSDLSQKWLKKKNQVFHLDLHSMPSRGTDFHPDPGQDRAEVVVSDFHGQSARLEFKQIVMKAYQEAGFQVAYNWPYVGGGITQMYGCPERGHHAIQVELNRAQYMNEKTKQIEESLFAATQIKLAKAIEAVVQGLESYLDG